MVTRLECTSSSPSSIVKSVSESSLDVAPAARVISPRNGSDGVLLLLSATWISSEVGTGRASALPGNPSAMKDRRARMLRFCRICTQCPPQVSLSEHFIVWQSLLDCSHVSHHRSTLDCLAST